MRLFKRKPAEEHPCPLCKWVFHSMDAVMIHVLYCPENPNRWENALQARRRA